MAYDEGLAERIRGVLDDERGVSEKRMFGGIAFLLDGKMFVGLAAGKLMVRVGPERHAAALREAHVRPMDFTGRPMVGYVYVGDAAIEEDAALERWVRMGRDFVATLPAKAKTKIKAKAKAKTPTKPKPANKRRRARK